MSSLILKHQVTVKLFISRSKSLSSSSSQPLSTCLSYLSPDCSIIQPVSSSTFSSLNAVQTSQTRTPDCQGSTSTTSDPLSCSIVSGRQSTIEICKGNLGLGLSIIGGCDTLLVRAANISFKTVMFVVYLFVTILIITI